MRILPAILPYGEYLKNIRNSDVVILPYSDPGYIWTGSGIMIDAIINKTPIVAPKVTAAGFEVERFNFGRTFSSEEEIVRLLEGRFWEKMELKSHEYCKLGKSNFH